MWTQQWPVTELKKLDEEARKIVVENGGNIRAVQLPSYTCQERREVEVCARSRRSTK